MYNLWQGGRMRTIRLTNAQAKICLKYIKKIFDGNTKDYTRLELIELSIIKNKIEEAK